MTATAVPVQTRSARLASTDLSDFPMPSGREVNWKYTPLAKLQPLLTGQLNGARYPLDVNHSDGITLRWGRHDDPLVGAAGTPEDRASAAAWAARDATLVITVRATDTAEQLILGRTFGTDAAAAHTIIVAEPGATGTIVVNNTGPATLTENVEILVGDNAHLTVLTAQEWDADALHAAAHFADVGRDAHLRHIAVTFGGDVIRINPSAHLTGDGSTAEMFGLYFADAGQHIEHQVYVNHDARNTTSDVTYKGALQGRGAHTVWIGDALISPDAIGTDSYEQNRNLVLTEGTRADSIPNLEIQCGDIIGAGHASATARFDDDQLFYLQARGIPEADAIRLVVRGFLMAMLQKIGVPAVEEHLAAELDRELTD
ncbi:Fe-S cluster assembly protein SufD [Curtobacterium sp. MCBA15_013]|uniref:Fe-S cluster assembly protein SufD n=1 Tax=Curtobacterium sp. MCBA15_013 TaxID=1898739 RepID=UPI0008DD5D8E|nr:Fe-S cluster assembly protein SufD [Curtobacterium sp. MCBA15_013]OII18386.1 Fe-S cluster assembly protein SufD [Curtobacterium sp. MCBA15_013]